MPEHAAWTVTYADGSILAEEDDQPLTLADFERMTGIALRPPDGGTILACIPQNVGARGIFFRRRAKGVFGDPNGSGLNVTCVGWQRTVNGTNVKTMLWLTDDGRILLTDSDLQDMGAQP